MMKWFFFFCISIGLISCNHTSGRDGDASFPELEMQFTSSLDSVQLAVYWYWISDNISKEGVIKDLHAMKSAGINKAFIGNIGLDDTPYGKTKFMSDEWWSILHVALKTATDLGIEIGIFNSPGWSQSGGPWVKPEMSMRYLANKSITVDGGKYNELALPDIEGGQDVKVLAYPFIPNVTFEWSATKVKKSSLEIVMELPDSVDRVRSLTIQTPSPLKTNATLYAFEQNRFNLIKSFEIDRSNFNIHVGFDPHAPVVIAVPEFKSSKFKLVLDETGEGRLSVKLSTKSYVERYPEKTFAKMFQYPLPMWADYMWDDQTESKECKIAKNQVLDLTDSISSESILRWNTPPGRWTVVRYAMKTTEQKNSPASPEAIGLEIDKMSKEHLSYHFNSFIGEILKRIPKQDRACFKVAVMDSYETGGLNWTDDMETRFEDTYAYSPIPFLPVLQGEIVESADVSNRFLWDLRRLIADRVAYDYVGGLREICHKHGLTTWLENYGHWGFPGEFLQYGGQSDEVAGEFWSEGTLGDIENRAASSCAHIYGKRKVWAESFTAAGKEFSRYPYVMKQRGDRFFTEGINSTLLHLYIQQPDDNIPGVNAWFGNEFNRNNTWFSQFDVFAHYLKRCNLMLQQGRFVADIAYFIGEDTPKMTGETIPEVPKGYSFDYINAEVLMEYSSVHDGCLTLQSGMKYKVLVLPRQLTMRPELLKKIYELVQDGLVVLGPSPQRSPSLQGYPESDSVVATLAANMWAATGEVNSCGKGIVCPDGYGLDKLLLELNILPDLVTEEQDSILFTHRTLKEGDIYFISNQTERKITFKPQFRIQNMRPELWNPQTAEIRELPDYTVGAGGIVVPLTLQPLESAFIVFRNPIDTVYAVPGMNFPPYADSIEIKGPWEVHFEEGKGVRPSHIVMDNLIDWTRHHNQEIRYFSGTARYITSFDVDKTENSPHRISLGKVMVMAKVYLNDQYVGGVWTPPYELDITKHVKRGKNRLEIDVVNNWMNRIIGNLNVPEKDRIGDTFVVTWSKDSPLQSSGLLGPVKVLYNVRY